MKHSETKKRIWSAIDESFQESFERNYKSERWFNLTYQEKENQTQVANYLIGWMTRFNNSYFPYKVKYVFEDENHHLKFKWVGFEKYKSL